MLASGILGRRNIYGIDIALEFPEEIFAGTEAPVRVIFHNRRKYMPAFLVRVTVNGEEAFFPYVAAGNSENEHVQLQFARRGAAQVEGVYISSVFPFNFFTRYRKIPSTYNLTIFPKPEKCELSCVDNRDSRKRGEKPSNVAGYDSDILSIRNYTSGDPIKYISWKSTAKTGHLKTRELSSQETEHVIIEFDKLDKRDLERTISCVTYVILKLVRANTPVGMRIGAEDYRPCTSSAHKVRLLKKLALYG
jgi:uncharacterized protein (DUF58 family)